MFRTESHRERVLLRLLEQAHRTISEQNDRIMALSGHPWKLDDQHFEPLQEEPVYQGALEGLPPEWDDDAE